MSGFRSKLEKYRFQIYLLSFILIILPPIGMYYAAQQDVIGVIWGLLGVVVLGSVLVVAIH